MSEIDDKKLKYLFSLARIKEEEDEGKRKKLLNDLKKILDYFNELQEIDTSAVKTMDGGTLLSNVFREDSERYLTGEERSGQAENIVDEFPEKENKKLKVPPVFE